MRHGVAQPWRQAPNKTNKTIQHRIKEEKNVSSLFLLLQGRAGAYPGRVAKLLICHPRLLYQAVQKRIPKLWLIIVDHRTNLYRSAPSMSFLDYGDETVCQSVHYKLKTIMTTMQVVAYLQGHQGNIRKTETSRCVRKKWLEIIFHRRVFYLSYTQNSSYKYLSSLLNTQTFSSIRFYINFVHLYAE